MPPVTSRTRSKLGSAASWFLLLTCALRAQQPATAAVAPAAETTIVEGRVVDMRGEGVPLANIWIAPRLEPDQVLARSVADGEGYFRVGKVPKRDDLQTRASADGYCTAIGMVFDTTTTTVTLQQAATVTGVLRNKVGTPMPDIDVMALVNGRSMRAVPCVARTDAEGRFVLRGVPIAPMQISAWIPGEGIASIAHRVAADCDVVVQPGNDATTAIAISVEGLPEEAMATLSISLWQQRHDGLARLPPPLDTIHMPQRTLRLDLLPDSDYRVSPLASGWQFTPRTVTLEPKRGPHTVAFTASPVDETLRGCRFEARDAAGKPAAGVALTMRGARGLGESSGSTDADGRVTINTTLAVGSKTVLMSIDDRWVTDQAKPEGTRPDLHDLGQHGFLVDPSHVEQVKLIAACSVRGRLLRHDGRPASFAWVELQDQRGNRRPEWLRAALTCTDRDGHFVLPRLHAVDAPVRVSIDSPLGALAGQPLDLSQPGTVIRLPDATLAQPSIVEGVLRDADQSPVAGVRVHLYDGGADLYMHRDETITDRDGRYRFLGVPPGDSSLRLQADPDDHPGTETSAGKFVVEAGRTHTHDLQLPTK